jgi:hypothetical protein
MPPFAQRPQTTLETIKTAPNRLIPHFMTLALNQPNGKIFLRTLHRHLKRLVRLAMFASLILLGSFLYHPLSR